MDADPREQAAPAPPPWLESAQRLVQQLPGLVSDRLELLALELDRSGRALAQIMVWVVAAAVVGATAWLALWCGVVAALIAWGWHGPLALGAVLLINLLACGLAVARVRRLVPLLGLPATRRHLRFSPDASTSTSTETPP